MKTFLFYLWNLTNDITTHLWLKQISVSIQTLFNQHSLLEKNWSPTFPNLNLIIRGLPLFLPVARQELLHWPWALTGVLEENSINITRYTVCTHGHKQTDRQLHRPVKQTLQTGCKHTWICFAYDSTTSKYPEKHSKHKKESPIKPNRHLRYYETTAIPNNYFDKVRKKEKRFNMFVELSLLNSMCFFFFIER